MKDRVDALQGKRQPESSRMGRDHFYDWEWAQVPMIKLLGWMLHFDVSGIQPDRISCFETRDRKAPTGQMLLVVLNGELKLITEVLMQILHVCGHFSSTLRQNRLKRNFEFWMEPLVSKQWSDTCGRMLGVVVGELCKGKQMLPVILLVVDEDPKVLLEDLVHPFCLPVSFWMVCHGEVGLDAKQLT